MGAVHGLLHSRVMQVRASFLGLLCLLASCRRILGFEDVVEGSDETTDAADGAMAALTEGLVAWYPCDGDPKLGLRDASGHGHTGSCVDECPVTIDSACRFRGWVGEYIQVPLTGEPGATELTIALWVRPSEHRGTLAGRTMAPAWSLGFSTGGCVVGSVELGADGVVTCLGSPQISTTQWTHLAGIWDGATTRIYVDGIERVTGTGRPLLDPGPFALGGAMYQGDLDEVRLYRRALTARDVRSLFETGRGGP